MQVKVVLSYYMGGQSTCKGVSNSWGVFAWKIAVLLFERAQAWRRVGRVALDSAREHETGRPSDSPARLSFLAAALLSGFWGRGNVLGVLGPLVLFRVCQR